MTYTGEIHKGVVVLDGSPQLEEGTKVRVEITSNRHKANAEAVLNNTARWHGPDGEIDCLVSELREMKQEELRLQLAKPDPEL
jgi:hypothetical protein